MSRKSSSSASTKNITEDYTFTNYDGAPDGGDAFNIQAARSSFGDVSVETLDDDVALAAIDANRESTGRAFETAINVSEASGDKFEMMLANVDKATQRALGGLQNAASIVAGRPVSENDTDQAALLKTAIKYGALLGGAYVVLNAGKGAK